MLVIGPPGSGKSTLGKQFLNTAAQKKGSSIVLSTADSKDVILQTMLSFGWETDGIRVVDCYSWRQGNTKSIDLRHLTDASITVSELLDNSGKEGALDCLVLDSFTDFLLTNETAAAVKFLAQLKSRLQARKFTALILMEDGPHDPKITSTVEYVTDGTIRTKFDETGRYLMVSRMTATRVQLGWSKFTIQKGIDVVVRNFFGAEGI